LLRAREALGLALGYSVPYGVTSGINLNSLAADAANTCRREPDVTSRADVLAAKASRDVARRNRDSVDWRFWPTIDVGSELKYADTIPATAGDHLTWTIFGVLTWELYDGGFRYGESTEKRARFDIAEQNLTEVQRKAGVEVAQSERGVRVAEANLRVSQRLRDVASESSRLSRIAFANGSGTSFDLVDTARRLREAELDLAIKEFELVTAKIKALLAVASCRI
jgi:outer membrane protein TolC